MKNPKLTIVDIGARHGPKSRWDNIDAIHVLIEPDKEEANKLLNEFPDAKVIDVGMWNKKDKKDFHLFRNRGRNSVFYINEMHLSDPEWKVEKTIQIQVDTLDAQLRENNLSDVDFITIDTQGSEFEILQGAKDTLTDCIGLEIEVWFDHFYRNTGLYSDIELFLRSYGFRVFDIRRSFRGIHRTPPWISKKGKGQLLTGDALFLKPFHAIETGIKLEKCFFVYLAYGYFHECALLLNNGAISPKKTQELETLLVSRMPFLESFCNLGEHRLFRRIFSKLLPHSWSTHVRSDLYLGNVFRRNISTQKKNKVEKDYPRS